MLFHRLASACVLAAAAATSLVVATPASAAAQQNCSNDNGIAYGQYYISAWQQNFNFGYRCRTWDGNSNDRIDYLWISLDQKGTSKSSGYDAGVGRNESGGTKLSRMDDSDRTNRGMYYKFTNNLTTESGGLWWMGPKTIISTTQFYSGLNGQYECYVVDNSNYSPAGLASTYGLQYVSEGQYDGATYKHYRTKLGEINQVWSIRQEYRNEGWSSVNWIQRQWVSSGLVPSANSVWNLGWKINFESGGRIYGNCGFSYLNLPWNNR